jgi:large repetitive protein
MTMYSRFSAGVFLVLSSSTLMAASISSFSPTIGGVNDQVTILGSGFFPGTLVVRFNGVIDPTAQAIAQDGTSIQAQVPAGATNGPISVSINGGAPTFSATDFTVIGPGPYITNFSPYVGSATTPVTIEGLHFFISQTDKATNAYFGGIRGDNFFVQSPNRITVNAPAGVTNGPISVRSTRGTFVSSNFFAPPVLTGFSPATGRATTNVTLTGINLLGATNAYINNMPLILGPATNNISWKVTLPPGITTGPVRVSTPAGSFVSSSNFVVLPTLFGFFPGSGTVGSSVTLTGANFNVGTPIVRFGGVAAAIVTNISFGQLSAVVPAGASNAPISITTSAGSHTNSAIFYLVPVLNSFSPTNSPPGSTITVTGQNLNGTTNVSFNGTSANFTVPTNNTSFQVVVPTNFTTGPISVTSPGGTAVSSGLFYAAPIVTGFAPTHGLPGTNVTITGSNFLGTTSVKFNGQTATFTPPTNNTTIHAVVPTNAQSGVITVIAPAGTNSSLDIFLIDSSDVSLGLTGLPGSVFVGSNLTYTLTITNLGPTAVPNVTVTNTLPLSVVLKSASSSQGSLATNANRIVASLGSLNAGSVANVVLIVVPQTLGSITNVATVTSGFPDPAIANNSALLSTTVLPLPILSVSLLSSNQVRLSWPVSLTNFSLESRTNLSLGGWANVITSPTISGNERVVIQTNTGTSSFYRLKN